MDRTTVNRIENGKRKVTVDDLGSLAVALNVPIPLLLLPVHGGADVALAPGAAAVPVWEAWEWMLGEQSLPGRSTDGEWYTSSSLLWRYEALRAALRALHKVEIYRHGEGVYWPKRTEDDPDLCVTGLQHLVDAVNDMEQAGLSTAGLIPEGYTKDIADLGIVPSPRVARYQSVAEVAEREAERGEH